MKILITGNSTYGLSAAIGKKCQHVSYVSRSTGFDLTTRDGREACAMLALEHDVFINCAALYQFNQTLLMDDVYKTCNSANVDIHMIAIGSTTDRVKNGRAWLYNAEKKALRDWCNTLAISGVWSSGPKVSYVSFGTLTNNQDKHPDRKCLDIDLTADYVLWLLSQPKYVNINEISIDPMQGAKWHE